MATLSSRQYGIGAEFKSAAALYHAAEKCRDKGFIRWDVHSPYPIHGMDDAMGLGRSRVSFLSLIGGIAGLASAFFLIWGTSADYLLPKWLPAILQQNYPLIVHGKPYFALESSVPIFFELTVLLTAFLTIAGVCLFSLMPRWNHPVFNWARFSKVSDDGFFVVIEAADPKFEETETRRFLEEIGGSNVEIIQEEED